MTGNRTGKSPTIVSGVVGMAPSIRQTSVDVPPMSKPMTRGWPAASATARAPTAPPAGPERIVRTAAARAAAAEIVPPFDCITANRSPARRASRAPR